MKRILAGMVAVALMTPCHVFGQAQPQGGTPSKNASVEQQLIKLEDEACVAVVNADVAFFDRNTADDFMDTWDDGTVAIKTQELENKRSGAVKWTSAANDGYKVRVYGNAAVVTYRSTVKGQFKGKDFSGQYRETDTWVQLGGHWQCVAAHDSKIVQAD